MPNADGCHYYYINAANKTIENLDITAGKKVVITGTNNTRMGGGLQILVSGTQVGSLKIYIDGNAEFNTSVNTASWAGALQLWTTGTLVEMKGNRTFCGCIFAPNALIYGNGNTDWFGSFVGKEFYGNGNKMAFHWDEGLSSLTGPIPWSLALWTELQSATDRAVYANRLSL